MYNIYSFETKKRNVTDDYRKQLKQLRWRDRRKKNVLDLAERYSARVKDFIQNYPQMQETLASSSKLSVSQNTKLQQPPLKFHIPSKDFRIATLAQVPWIPQNQKLFRVRERNKELQGDFHFNLTHLSDDDGKLKSCYGNHDTSRKNSFIRDQRKFLLGTQTGNLNDSIRQIERKIQLNYSEDFIEELNNQSQPEQSFFNYHQASHSSTARKNHMRLKTHFKGAQEVALNRQLNSFLMNQTNDVNKLFDITSLREDSDNQLIDKARSLLRSTYKDKRRVL